MVEWIENFMVNQPIASIVDILLVWFLIYRIIVYARGTRAMNLLRGVGFIILAKFISSTFGLQTIDWLLGQVISWGVVATIILFQPELRKGLENLGRNLFINRRSAKNPSQKLIDDLETSLLYMSKRKIGALISIEANDKLSEYIETGTSMDSKISSQLLINIFIPNTPLHDGAMIISDYRIAAASCYLPLSESSLIPKELGTRHRAAIGLGEATDALTLIVSEETGSISIVKQDRLHRDLKPLELRTLLEDNLMVEYDTNEERDAMQIMKEFFTTNFTQRGGKQ